MASAGNIVFQLMLCYNKKQSKAKAAASACRIKMRLWRHKVPTLFYCNSKSRCMAAFPPAAVIKTPF